MMHILLINYYIIILIMTNLCLLAFVKMKNVVTDVNLMILKQVIMTFAHLNVHCHQKYTRKK